MGDSAVKQAAFFSGWMRRGSVVSHSNYGSISSSSATGETDGADTSDGGFANGRNDLPYRVITVAIKE